VHFGPRFMHRVELGHGDQTLRSKFLKVCILHPVKKVPRGGECAQMVVGMLYNAFGPCIWCVVVCGHCVLD